VKKSLLIASLAALDDHVGQGAVVLTGTCRLAPLTRGALVVGEQNSVVVADGDGVGLQRVADEGVGRQRVARAQVLSRSGKDEAHGGQDNRKLHDGGWKGGVERLR